MDGLWKVTSLSLLLFGGCLSTASTVYRLSDDADPFRFASSSPFPTPPPAPSFDPVHTDDISDGPMIIEVANAIPEEDEFQFESDNASPLSEAEQAELLLPNQWVKNLALINWLDTGKKPTLNDISPGERKRLDDINRLNMSRDELAKRGNRQFDYASGLVSDWRWMHRGVDQLSAIPPEQRESAEVFWRNRKYQDNKYKTLRSNAAILLGRDGNPKVASLLLQLVQDDATPINIRCATAEVLGRMPTVTADDLIPLLDKVKDREIETTDRKTGERIPQHQVGITDIWEELLIAIAEKIDPWEHACFLEPFHASTIEIRLKTAKIWRMKSLQKRPVNRSLPEKFLELAQQETSPTMRIEIIRTLGAWRVPDLFRFLEADLRHRTAEVRNAAMLALADVGSQEAIPIIKDQLRDSNSASRAAAVSALRKLGALDEVFKLAGDQDRLVRIEVAQAFAERCTSQAATLAKSYLSDRDAKVQSATVEAIGGWSIEESGPLFLLAAKSFHPDVRRRAADLLAQRGVSCPHFDPADRPENQTAQHQELVQIFRESVGIDPSLELAGKEHSAKNNSTIRQVSAIVPENYALTEVRRCLDDWSDRTLPQDQRQLIQRRLTAHGQRLMPAVDHLLTVENRNIPESLDRVFAEVEPIFGEIEKLKSGDVTVQQRAARELARLGAIDSPSKLAAKRIIDQAAQQSDPIVLTSLLTALKNADPDLVCQLARPLLQSESAEVRRVSCEMLKQFGNSEDVVLLQEALRDPNPIVVRGALQAIDSLLEEGDTNDSSVFETLKAMLMQGDLRLQTDVAATLHRLGHSEGTDALRRLAASNDYRIKSYVAQSVSALEDPVFVPILLRYLDDGNGTVRSEALKGLPRLVGQDIGRSGLHPHSDVSQTQQQIDRWKAWAKERRN